MVRAAKKVFVEQVLYSVPEAAAMYGVADDTMWQWVALREIPSVKIGRLRKIKKSDLDRYIEDNTIPAREKAS